LRRANYLRQFGGGLCSQLAVRSTPPNWRGELARFACAAVVKEGRGEEERGAPPNVELHRASCPAGTVGAVFSLLPGLFVGAYPAGRRHPYATRPGSRPNARKSRKGAAGVGSGPPFPGAVPHLDGRGATGRSSGSLRRRGSIRG